MKYTYHGPFYDERWRFGKGGQIDPPPLIRWAPLEPLIPDRVKKLQGNKMAFDFLKEMTTLLLKKHQGNRMRLDFFIAIAYDHTTT